MSSSIPLGRVAGIRIRVHFTWVFAFALITWSIATAFLPMAFPRWRETAYWGTAAGASLLLFASVLLHEISHSVVARALGFKVEGITLFILGGVSKVIGEAKRPWDEFAIAVVGPLTSLALAVAFGAAFWPARHADSPLTAILGYLALVNGMLAVFNLLPGLPLDGGRVLRSVIWALTRNAFVATVLSVWMGRLIGLGFIGWGAFLFLNDDAFGGLWTIFVGWFLIASAGGVLREARWVELLRRATVNEVMEPQPVNVAPGAMLGEVFRDHILRRGQHAVLVSNGDGPLGILTRSDLRRVPRTRWEETAAADAMTRAPLHSVNQEADLASALRIMNEHEVRQLVVTDGDRVVGMIDTVQVERFAETAAPAGRGFLRRGAERRGQQGQEM